MYTLKINSALRDSNTSVSIFCLNLTLFFNLFSFVSKIISGFVASKWSGFTSWTRDLAFFVQRLFCVFSVLSTCHLPRVSFYHLIIFFEQVSITVHSMIVLCVIVGVNFSIKVGLLQPLKLKFEKESRKDFSWCLLYNKLIAKISLVLL